MANGIIARMEKEQMCACGKPLHYRNPELRVLVQNLVDQLGENVKVVCYGRTWLVPRHYISLHGIKTWELEKLGFQEVTNNDAEN